MLVGGLEHFLFSHMLGIILPTDFHIFQRGRYTTNQDINTEDLGPHSSADSWLNVDPRCQGVGRLLSRHGLFSGSTVVGGW